MKQSKTKNSSVKEKILEAAITVFSQSGFDAARTRDICALAEVNISTLHYHFKSKDNIYKSVIQKINDQTNQSMMPTMIRQHEIITNSKNKEEIISAIKIMATTFVQAVTSKERRRLSKIIAFEQIEQSKHFKILFENVMKRVCDPFRLASSKIIGKKTSHMEVILTTHTLMGMLSSFQHSKSSLMYVSGWKDYNQSNEKHIKKHIAKTIDKLFFPYLSNETKN
ncbi:MAG: transcriptional regulator [Rickettsiaceae bacterium]|jgi:AcrR family transcriptional regulator|nr:transcriptional regulator [Rickettsiaceae bacterium]